MSDIVWQQQQRKALQQVILGLGDLYRSLVINMDELKLIMDFMITKCGDVGHEFDHSVQPPRCKWCGAMFMASGLQTLVAHND